MGKPVVITADSTVDLYPELIKRYHIHIIPLTITLGEDVFQDGHGFTPLERPEYRSFWISLLPLQRQAMRSYTWTSALNFPTPSMLPVLPRRSWRAFIRWTAGCSRRA